MKKGFFLTFEGCEGVGKSTQIKLLEQVLKDRGVDYIRTREPGGCPIAERIRELLLSRENAEMGDECEALLYAAARAEHLKDTVIPALEEGKLVLCDRYLDSSLAYQGYARGLTVEFVEKVNAPAFSSRLPDCTLFLDLPPDAAFQRKGGADKSDRVEMSGMPFHRKVYQGYVALSERYPERIVRVDCSGTKYETHEKIVRLLEEKGAI